MKVKILSSKIRGGALLPTLLLAFLLSSICFAFIVYNYLLKEEFILNNTHVILERNCDSGINILLSVEANDDISDSTIIDLFNEGTDSVQLMKKSWGVYDIVYSKAKKGRIKKEKVLLTGIGNDDKFSLYIEDRDKPITLCGKAFVGGTCYLPKPGITQAYLDGIPFTGSLPKNYNHSKKKLNLPSSELFIELKEDLSSYQQIITVEDLPDTIIQSFKHEAKKFLSLKPIELNGNHLTGNIIIRSLDEIVIGPETCTEDIIVIAPKIKLKNGFTGSIQCIATDSIIVDEDVHIKYPSALVLLQQKITTNGTQSIIIYKKSTLEGSIIALSNQEIIKPTHQIIVKPEVTIKGEIITDSKLNFMGSIHGRIVARLIYAEKSSYYENYLIDGKIYHDSLPESFAFSRVFNREGNGLKTIAKALK